jgi:hypothetical protein
MVWKFLKKLKMQLPSSSTIPLLVVYPKEILSEISQGQKDENHMFSVICGRQI